MITTRRQTRIVLRSLLPLLALVWTSLPLHRCQLAFAAPPVVAESGAGPIAATAATAVVHCEHQSHGDERRAPTRQQAAVDCRDLGRVAPDLRPTLPDFGIAVFVWRIWLPATTTDPSDDAAMLRYRSGMFIDGWGPLQRPVYLRKSALLI